MRQGLGLRNLAQDDPSKRPALAVLAIALVAGLHSSGREVSNSTQKVYLAVLQTDLSYHSTACSGAVQTDESQMASPAAAGQPWSLSSGADFQHTAVGLGDSEDVHDVVSGLVLDSLEEAAALAELSPPLTIRKMQFQQPAGKLVLNVRGV